MAPFAAFVSPTGNHAVCDKVVPCCPGEAPMIATLRP